MWDSIPVLNAVAFWGLVVGGVGGGVAVIASLVGGVAATRASELSGVAAEKSIATANSRAALANARAEEAKAETAKANERIQKMQVPRKLTLEQIEGLKTLFRADVFQKPKRKKLRVSSVEDSEARMFAMEMQKLMESCGIDIYPTDGGFPSSCVQLTPDSAPLVLTVKSGEAHEGMQHFAYFERVMLAMGFEMPIEFDPALQSDEGVLHVMRKRPI